MQCQYHEDRLSIAPTWQPFMCAECAQACIWCNEQGQPDACKRDQEVSDSSKYLGWEYRPSQFYCTLGKRQAGLAARPSAAELFEATWTPRMAGEL